MDVKETIEIIEFTDPACTWCWGSEPILRKLEFLYKENIEINFIMGGLVEDMRNFRDPRNGIGGDLSKVNKEIAKHWLKAASRHHMPVDAINFSLFDEENTSTYPMNIAYKAAQFQDKKLAKTFLRRMREAIASEGKRANRIEVLIELAQDSGLNVSKFLENFKDGTAVKEFEKDLYTTRLYKASGFPTFLIKSSTGKEVLLKGFQSYETFKEVISQITDGNVIENKFEINEQVIADFVNKFGRVAPVELEVTFDLNKVEVEGYIEILKSKNLINIEEAGNGYFISIKNDSFSCDSEKGICNI